MDGSLAGARQRHIFPVLPGAGFGEAPRDGLLGERGVVPFAREAFFLRCGDELAVLDEARGAVVVEGREAEDVRRSAQTRADGNTSFRGS